jgi:hypothetical protein
MRFMATSVVAVAVVAIIAGCGGSSNSATSAATTASSAAAASSAPAATTTSTVAPSFASAQNCLQLSGLGAKFAQAMSATTSGGKFDLQTVVNAYQALANAAPSEIRPDLQVIAQEFTAFATALSKAGYTPGTVPTAGQIAALQTAAQAFSQPQLRAAEQRLSVWARHNCG